MADPTTIEPGGQPGDDPPSLELAQRDPIASRAVDVMPLITDEEIRRAWRVANALSQSRVFKDAGTAERAFAKIVLGRDLGLSPTQALMTLDVVKDNIQIRGVALLSFIRKSDRYDYEIREHTAEKATLAFYGLSKRTGEWVELGESTFTVEDAENAQLIPSDKRAAWHTARPNMLIWRAASNGVKFFAPDMLGGLPVYTEADSFPDDRPQIGQGNGDGSEPGWQIPDDEIRVAEALLARAEKAGVPLDRRTVKLELNGQPVERIHEWFDRTGAEIAAAERQASEPDLPDADVIPDQPQDDQPSEDGMSTSDALPGI